MKNLVQLKKSIDPVRDSLNRPSCRRGFLLIPLALGFGFFALPSAGRADCREGCWFGSTFLGEDAFGSVLPYLYDTAIGGGAMLTPGSGVYNVGVGHVAFANNETGWYNTAIGAFSIPQNTTGWYNTATGAWALYGNTTGYYNTATGYGALYTLSAPQTGSFNTANGAFTLADNTSGSLNTASGFRALDSNTTGNNNTATGAYAFCNSLGDNNTATGHAALFGSPERSAASYNNTANGAFALYNNTTGSNNTASGLSALGTNTEGSGNTATGLGALNLNTTGSNNLAEGLQALLNNTSGNENTAIGLNALFSNTTGSRNIALGAGAGGALTTGSDNIAIGNGGVTDESATIRIGITGAHQNTYIAGIYGMTLGRTAAPVFIDSAGHLGTRSSAARFKDTIRPMDKASEAILALRPVMFHYKKELDPDGTAQFGLVAEQVETVNPDLVVRDKEGKAYTVRYDAVNAMLLNEFLKEHRKVEEQETIIGELKATTAKQTAMLARQEKAIATLTSQVQKVSARVEAQQAAPRLASE